jgi:pyridoxine/pyridoxamine 5'-phosphate oxidase
MFISTCGENQPSIRPVLLKEVKENNFIFFTNYESKKSQDMDKNNKVAACFYWEPLQRCVRIEGKYILVKVTLKNYPNLKVSPISHKDLVNPS